MNVSLVVGDFAEPAGSRIRRCRSFNISPAVGVDYYIWVLQISGFGTLLTGINFFVTIVKMRAPGMTLMKMPVFVWTSLCTNMLISPRSRSSRRRSRCWRWTVTSACISSPTTPAATR